MPYGFDLIIWQRLGSVEGVVQGGGGTGPTGGPVMGGGYIQNQWQHTPSPTYDTVSQ